MTNTDNNRWKKLSSKVAYQNKWTTMLEDEIEDPAGRKGIYGYIDREVAFGVWPLFEKNGEFYTYLVSQFRYPVQRRLKQIILEGGEGHETEQEGVTRALREELGMKTDKIALIGEAYTDPGLNTELMKYYIAEGLTDIGDAELDDTEIDLKVHEVPVKKLAKMIKSGEIQDQHSITAIHFLQNYLDK